MRIPGRSATFARAAAALVVMGCAALLPAARVADLGRDGIAVYVDAEPETIDLARDFFVTVTVTAPAGVMPALPDLRDRFTGFRVAEDFTEDPVVDASGATTCVSRWRLVPQPSARRWRLAPFVVTAAPQASFATASVCFAPPPPRPPVTGEMEIEPRRDLPPLSWRLAGMGALALAGAGLLFALVWYAVRRIREALRVYRLSPLQRALYELERLLAKGLPGRGRYKDFYVELTMVVRRYIQRRHGVKAPHLTTDEFLRAAQDSPFFTRASLEELRHFLESSDLVKFAGVEATPEMADDATRRARTYLKTDSSQAVDKS